MGMPVPVISSTQSVLSVAQWQDFSLNGDDQNDTSGEVKFGIAKI
jgi:hypothetical protein